MTTTAIPVEARPKVKFTPPAPLVKPLKHPLKWTINKAQSIGYAVVFTYLGTLIITAIYYLLFELNPTMNHAWHSAVSDSDLRHNIRGVAEGLLGGFLAQQIIWNHYKRSVLKKNYKPITVQKLLFSPIKAILYALPGFVVGYFVVKGFHNAHEHLRTIVALPQDMKHSSLAIKTEAAWVQGWPQKVIGFFASFFLGRRAMRSTFDGMQRWLAEQKVIQGKKVHWYHAPTYRARYNEIHAIGVSGTAHPKAQVTGMLVLLGIGTCLAAYGWYILAYIAN